MSFHVDVNLVQAEWSISEVRERLDALACQSSSEHGVQWGLPVAVVDESRHVVLNQLRAQVLETDDRDLISLFRRAVRNHDTLYPKQQAEVVPTYNKHYQAPDFTIPDIDLILDVQEDHILVTTKLSVVRENDCRTLVLDGLEHDVQKVIIDGHELTEDQYQVTKHELIIFHVPGCEKFNVEIQSKVNPFQNESMEGMYQSGDWLTTQCESEGARRIFYTLDRPDVLSHFTSTIIADPVKYPYRISNGNLVNESDRADGRRSITWEDPFPKPSYLFAAVLGDFGVINDTYKTKSGREVTLEVYVEKGKEDRARFSLWALKKSMEFDEQFFDREYDLDVLKMVGMPNFNAGAMENKGLLIFNDTCLLVDSNSGKDSDFRWVAGVVMHEYAHNWSGNRVTVRNWFELALKEAFTDFRAILFLDWLFTEEYTRPDQVEDLVEGQFSEDAGPAAHSIQVDSYVESNDLYDGTTYTKGREVFRMLKTILDENPGGDFRKAQNAYFSKYDGQAVTFRELLSTVSEECDIDLSIYERWFHQAGTPKVSIRMDYDSEAHVAKLSVKQSCPSPKDGAEQDPFHIPFSIELLGADGSVLSPTAMHHFKEHETVYTIEGVSERPTPVFMHGFSAPVKMEYDYSDADLMIMMIHEKDAYSRKHASEIYAQRVLHRLYGSIQRGESDIRVPDDVLLAYEQVLTSDELSPLAKTQALQLPSVRSIASEFDEYDFVTAEKARDILKKAIADKNEAVFRQSIRECSELPMDSLDLDRISENMKLRDWRNACYSYLFATGKNSYHSAVLCRVDTANTFNDKMHSIRLVAVLDDPRSGEVLRRIHEEWKDDKAMFNEWITCQTGGNNATVETLERVQRSEGYDAKNPNHIRSVFRTFVNNLARYHDPEGRGYAYVTNGILEVAKTNAHLATNYIAKEAYQDFKKLPERQRGLMAEQLRIIQAAPDVHVSLRAYAGSLLDE